MLFFGRGGVYGIIYAVVLFGVGGWNEISSRYLRVQLRDRQRHGEVAAFGVRREGYANVNRLFGS